MIRRENSCGRLLFRRFDVRGFDEAKVRGGYTVYDFSQMSLTVPAVNENTWYANVDLRNTLPTEKTFAK